MSGTSGFRSADGAAVKVRWAAASLLVVTAIYLAALVWVDAKRNVFAELPALVSTLPPLFASAAICWLLRFVRWHWLLQRAGHNVPVGRGLLAYVAGFAFTATPGKVGELIRIRYLAAMGVPPHSVVAAFVYERVLDLLIVLMVASLAAAPFGLLPLVASFVAAVVVAVVVLARNPQWLQGLALQCASRGFDRLAAVASTLGAGFAGAGVWMNLRDLVLSITLGALAWTVPSLAFAWWLGRLGIGVELATAVAILPLAQLAGAASMLPGGIGSTEAAIVSMLVASHAPLALATLAAIGIRIATLWGAIAWGLAALLWLEYGGGLRAEARHQGTLGND